MTLEQRVEVASSATNPFPQLTALVHTLSSEGLTKRAIAVAMYDAYKRHRDDSDETQSDTLAEILDFLTGFCSPHARLLPDEPNVQL